MNAINVNLAIRNNILAFMRKKMKPVTQGEVLDDCDLPKGLHKSQLLTAVNRAFRSLVESREIIRVPVENRTGLFEARYTYRLAGPLDPAPKVIRAYAPRGTGPKAQLLKKQREAAEANAVAARMREEAAAAEVAKGRNDPRTEALGVSPNASAPVMQAMADNYMTDRDKAYAKKDYDSIPIPAEAILFTKRVQEANTLPPGVNVEVTSTGVTITLGKITVTVKAD